MATSFLSILHVLAPSAAGGAESVVRSLATGQRAIGHQVRVAAVVGREGRQHPFVVSLCETGIETDAITIPDRAYLREQAMIGELCGRYRPAIVHTHGFRADVVDAAVARRQGVPTITTVHGFTGGGWKVRLYERIQRRAFRRFDAVAAVSRPLAEHLATSGVPKDRIHLVPNAHAGLETPLERAAARRRISVPEDQFLVGWVGRLSQEKGLDVLLEAAAQSWDLPLKIAVLGDGPEREHLRRRAAVLGVADRVTWHGIVRDAAVLFSAFDVFVLSSRTEGMPIVLFEAMSASVPIIASRVGGVPDVLSEREAILVPPNEPRVLADALRNVCRDWAAAALRARAAHQRLERDFGFEPWLSRYERLYRHIQKPLVGTPT